MAKEEQVFVTTVEAEMTILMPVRVKVSMEVDTAETSKRKAEKAAIATVKALKLDKPGCRATIDECELESVVDIDGSTVEGDFADEPGLTDIIQMVPSGKVIESIHSVKVTNHRAVDLV